MKLTILLAALSWVLASASTLPQRDQHPACTSEPLIPKFNPVDEYSILRKMCIEGGNDAVLAIRYSDGKREVFKEGECAATAEQSRCAQKVVVCQNIHCFVSRSTSAPCTDYMPPVGVPFPDGITLDNMGNIYNGIGQSTKCYKGM
ncbi:hypothetical protein DL96DRAFT_1740159 [Flagelloscypha sp. PMI_526]|nr:hypothetical protein DL96DRAFT_1740159 [Flagelloscypha sp. PMI_526]